MESPASHEMLIIPQQETQRATQNVDEFEAQVRMRLGVLFRGREKLSQIRMKFSLSSSGVEPGQD